MKIPFPLLSSVLATGLTYGVGIMVFPKKAATGSAAQSILSQSMTPADAAAAL
jgi:hypothetical protein